MISAFSRYICIFVRTMQLYSVDTPVQVDSIISHFRRIIWSFVRFLITFNRLNNIDRIQLILSIISYTVKRVYFFCLYSMYLYILFWKYTKEFYWNCVNLPFSDTRKWFSSAWTLGNFIREIAQPYKIWMIFFILHSVKWKRISANFTIRDMIFAEFRMVFLAAELWM